ncbi:MAG TPA: N-acetylmuramoyl-L-alanine amidase [Bacteroidales bacterium]|nr:N-acetylmuramoyl-L-alanine amidase [Bacteroidales bacterium]
MNKKCTVLIFQRFFILFYVFILGPVSIAAQTPDNGYKLKTVVIDAGHGGKDPGSIGKHATEKELALAIALKAGKYIEENIPEVKVIYTRKTDVFVPLLERAEIANKNKADLIISIHVNAISNPQISGTMTLVLGLNRTSENFEVAKKENSVILLEDNYNTKYAGFDPNDPESYIMFSLMQNLYFDQSVIIAGLVQDQFREKAQRSDKGVKRQGLLVLAQSAMPGILVETGFLSNPDEEAFLMSKQGQDYLASAIYRAFRDYKDIVDSKSTLTASLGNRHVVITDSNSLDPTDTSSGVDPDPVAPDNRFETKKPDIQFKVQIAASLKPITQGSHLFKGMKDVSQYRVGNYYKYAVGSSSTFKDIIPYSKTVKEKFPDAFIIAVKNDTIIPLDRALKEQ